MEEPSVRPSTGGSFRSEAHTHVLSRAGEEVCGSTTSDIRSRSQPATVAYSSASRRSRPGTSSTARLEDLQKNKLLRTLRRKEVSAKAEYDSKRSALDDYRSNVEAAMDRERQKQFAMPAHLRTGPGPINMGSPPSYVTQTHQAQDLACKMSVDPKWSTDLQRTNLRVMQRCDYNRKLSASVPGAMLPEAKHMRPKVFLSNPPTPFFVPGRKDS
eukprot:TRINITY_DN25360_c0_g1_i1.p1 TRINITY_DN25360_c0_g1~~TRINITY_DN25360_c0_g1_i1.p1  ORF type:complete len:214 (-),score=31.28 TRINITY_DN25360_c0_g1_i1:49-690(-)